MADTAAVSRILNADDVTTAAATQILEGMTTKELDVGGIIDMIFGLIDLFSRCSGDDEGNDAQRIIDMAKKGRGAIMGRARQQVRDQGIRGRRNISQASREFVKEIGQMTVAEVQAVLSDGGF